MKRDQNLISLSKEHHYGLLFCWKLKQGVQKQAAPNILRSYVSYYWEKQLKQHFAREDSVLGHLLPQDHEIQQQLEQEHREIDQKVKAIIQGVETSAADFTELAEILIRHIRFEERQFFPYLEQSLSTGQLEEIGRLLPSGKMREEDDFSPAFWTREYVPDKQALSCLAEAGNRC